MKMPVREIIYSKWIYFIGFIGAYITPIKESMLAVGVLIFLDLIFGLIGAVKKKEKISSKRLAETIVKMLVYQLLILSAHVVETSLVDWIPFTKITLSFIGITELLSIGENFTKITGMPFVQYLKNVVKNYTKNSALRDTIEAKEKDVK